MTDIALRVQNLSKCYQIYDKPHDRLKQFIMPKLHRVVSPLRRGFPTSHSPLSTDQGAPTPRSPLITHPEPLPTLINQLRGLIESARQQALRAVDTLQVRTCWEIGRHIVEFEQQGAERASYGTRLISKLATTLTTEFGRSFGERNLRHMRAFSKAFRFGTQCVPN